jgi:hypothetical protein
MWSAISLDSQKRQYFLGRHVPNTEEEFCPPENFKANSMYLQNTHVKDNTYFLDR